MEKPIARGYYDERYDEGIKCTAAEGRTKQSFTEDCDINKIIERFARTGMLPEQVEKTYGDFSNVVDYVQAHQLVQNAQDQFNQIDARTRARFENDPAKFLAFATDAKNIDEMVELGLAIKKPSQAVKTDSQATAEVSK